MKLYVVSGGKNGKESIDGIYYLVTEEGEVLYSHWCSSIGFAMDDLYTTRPERIKECEKRWGNVEVLMLGDDNMTNDELKSRNHQWYKKNKNK